MIPVDVVRQMYHAAYTKIPYSSHVLSQMLMNSVSRMGYPSYRPKNIGAHLASLDRVMDRHIADFKPLALEPIRLPIELVKAELRMQRMSGAVEFDI